MHPENFIIPSGKFRPSDHLRRATAAGENRPSGWDMEAFFAMPMNLARNRSAVYASSYEIMIHNRLKMALKLPAANGRLGSFSSG